MANAAARIPTSLDVIVTSCCTRLVEAVRARQWGIRDGASSGIGTHGLHIADCRSLPLERSGLESGRRIRMRPAHGRSIIPLRQSVARAPGLLEGTPRLSEA